MINEEDLKAAVEIIRDSEYIVVFTGAGSSTESGIADFRSEGGLWSKYDPSIYANYWHFVQDPAPFWEMHRELEGIVANAPPNPTHEVLAELEKMGKVKAIITQNIDMLHQKAGSGKYGAKIYQLHGEYGTLECIKCRKTFNYKEIDTKSVKYPVCECGGFIKPKVILFGESLPSSVLDGARNACYKADCLLMVGSSLMVSPANMIPAIAKQNGAKVIFINRDPTMMDEIADIFLKGSSSEILLRIIELLNEKASN
ncbi:MAG: SIR2 family NAD-dependent protein deacylase [Promethearchaeota archaeon]